MTDALNPDVIGQPDHDLTLERTALKEWAVIVDAMATGDLVAMVRKGGIREQRAGFSVRHDRFMLYPTFFHEKVADLAPRLVPALDASHATQPAAGTLRLDYVAHVAAVWAVNELEPLRSIEREHGLAWSAVESRFHYKGRPGVQVVAVRIARLLQPAVVPDQRRYGGCVSWVELDEPIDVSGVQPVVDDSSFARRLASLTSALGVPHQTG